LFNSEVLLHDIGRCQQSAPNPFYCPRILQKGARASFIAPCELSAFFCSRQSALYFSRN
jgi:hypothetical protein